MSFIFLLLGGICMGLMISLNGQLASYLNILEVSFLVHAIGAILLVGYMKIRKERISLKGLPLYIYTVGFLGVALVASSSLCVNRIGATLTMALSVTGQLLVSAVIDHFGLFHVPVVKFNLRRVPSYLIIGLGLFIIINA